MGIAQNTIYRVFRRFEEGVGVKRKSWSGRPAVKLPSKQANKMTKKILSKVGSHRQKWGKILSSSQKDWKSLKEK